MADLAQVWTQHAGRRAYAGMMILCSVDDEAGPQLYKVDPAGHFFGFKAVAAGPKYLESTTRLEKCVKEDGIEHDSENTIRNLIMQLQAVLSTDFKSSEIEIAVVELNEKFRTLSEEEIDEHLTAIAERDWGRRRKEEGGRRRRKQVLDQIYYIMNKNFFLKNFYFYFYNLYFIFIFK